MFNGRQGTRTGARAALGAAAGVVAVITISACVPPPAAPVGTVVERIVDGDTLAVADGETVRLIGIDTPEVGQCGYAEAAARLTQLVGGRSVTLTPGARDDRDRYGRLLRYIDAGGVDVQLEMLKAGLAIARYDSRDGYGAHPREAAFIAADNASPNVCSTLIVPPPPPSQPPTPTMPPVGVHYENCTAARAAGAAPIYIGQPGYRAALDGDGDGVACE